MHSGGAVVQFREVQTANGRLAIRRQQQSLAWMWERIDTGLREAFRTSPQVREVLPAVQENVRLGQLAASTAARQLLQRSGSDDDPSNIAAASRPSPA